jgi:pantoate--beta-alanine ligase
VEVVRRVNAMKEICRRGRSRGRRIGFVATMGALHEGHLSLIRAARELSDILIVSIFVNPTQFGPQEDFDKYPRDLAHDSDLCIGERVDYLFCPEAVEIYPEGAQTFVDVTEISRGYEGERRPGHFRGVATVVLKLFQIVEPSVALFGQKDAQQSALIRRMVRDLMLDVEILVQPTVRDADGLALSSRNRYLDDEQRESALAIPRSLSAARDRLADGERDPGKIVAAARELLEAAPGVEIDYVGLVDGESFEDIEKVEGEMLIVVAARVGKTCLIDNLGLQA